MTVSFRPAAGPVLAGGDPADGIVVTGGVGVAAVDAAEVRLAAARVGAVVDGLRRAAELSGGVWAEVAGGVGLPSSAGFLPGAVARRRAAADAVDVVTAGLRQDAAVFELLGLRLLRAAGLYEEVEGRIEGLVGGLVTAEGFVLGRMLGTEPVVRLLGGVYRAVGSLPAAGAGARAGEGGTTGAAGAGGAPPRGANSPGEGGRHGRTAGGFGGAVVRGVAPWTDEFVSGVGHGLARSGGARPGVRGAAGELADAVRLAPGGALGHRSRVERAGSGEFRDGLPAWHGRAAGTLDQALSRVGDLSPRRGAPPATVAVQRLVGPRGTVSWMVLVPGTQSVPPAGHPWDGLTDLELVAGRPDQATQAVEAAMADAGVGRGEPVVLVGHSLGGIAVTALAGRPTFTERYRVGGVVTAGAPVATLATAPGVPVLHLETAEEVISALDGGSGAENPRTPDRVTVGRTLAESAAAADQVAAGDVSRAHSIGTHVRTLELARQSGDVRVAAVVDRIEPLLRAEHARTLFYRAERAATAPVSPGAAPDPAGSP